MVEAIFSIQVCCAFSCAAAASRCAVSRDSRARVWSSICFCSAAASARSRFSNSGSAFGLG
jgi:hypothetical protein